MEKMNVKTGCQSQSPFAVIVWRRDAMAVKLSFFLFFFTFITIFPNPINRSFLLCSTEEEKNTL